MTLILALVSLANLLAFTSGQSTTLPSSIPSGSITSLPLPTGSSIIQNTGFGNTTGSTPGGWDLQGAGATVPLPDGTNAFQLQSNDPNKPAQLSQNVPTVPGQPYNLAFQSFYTGNTTAQGQRNLTVGFGGNTFNPQPGNGWEQYEFGGAGNGPNDRLSFSSYDTTGGSYVINQIIMTPNTGGSPTVYSSSAAINSPTPTTTILIQDSGGGDDGLNKAQLIGAIIGPILAVLTAAGGAFAWYWNEKKERDSKREEKANAGKNVDEAGDKATANPHTPEEKIADAA